VRANAEAASKKAGSRAAAAYATRAFSQRHRSSAASPRRKLSTAEAEILEGL
jgi:hypothetical protein